MRATPFKTVCLLIILGLLAGAAPGAGRTAFAQEETASAAAYPGWVQRNANGFGSPANTMVSALEVYKDTLYAGTWREPRGQVWRSPDGKSWSQFPLSLATGNVVRDLAVFQDRLYVGAGSEPTGVGEIWRTGGSTWQKVTGTGLGDANNIAFVAFIVFKDQLYAAATNTVTGTEIWRSPTGNPGTWTQVNPDGFGGTTNNLETSLAVFEGKLYAGVTREDLSAVTLAELWSSADGVNWDPVFTDGLGVNTNRRIRSMLVFEEQLYIGFHNLATGAQLWRSPDGSTWNVVFDDGLGDVDNGRPDGMIAYGEELYMVFSNTVTGAQVWRSPDGLNWRREVSGGWGDADNQYAHYNNKGAAVFQGSLYTGTLNEVDGGQVWMKLHTVYMPGVLGEFTPTQCNTRPSLIFPANGSQISNLIPMYKFDLGNNPAADGSRLRIAKDPGFTNVVSSWWMGSSTGVKEFRDIYNLEPATTYYWRAWLMCGEEQGPYSDTWSFKSGSGGVILPAPTLIAPPDGSLLPDPYTTLKWGAVGGSLDYEIFLFDRTASTIWVDIASGTESMTGLTPGNHYSWWVYARNAYAYGNSSAEWFFDAPAAVAGAPLPQVPGYDVRVGPDGVRYLVP